MCVAAKSFHFTEVMAPTLSGGSDEGPIPLPDIRDQLKRKELQQKIAQMEAEEEAKKVKIKRSDREAFTKVRMSATTFLRSQLSWCWT